MGGVSKACDTFIDRNGKSFGIGSTVRKVNNVTVIGDDGTRRKVTMYCEGIVDKVLYDNAIGLRYTEEQDKRNMEGVRTNHFIILPNCVSVYNQEDWGSYR